MARSGWRDCAEARASRRRHGRFESPVQEGQDGLDVAERFDQHVGLARCASWSAVVWPVGTATQRAPIERPHAMSFTVSPMTIT